MHSVISHVHHNLLHSFKDPKQKLCELNNLVVSKQNCIDYKEKWPEMVIFLYNLYIFGYNMFEVHI